LEAHFYAVVDRFNATPLVILIPDPVTGTPVPQLLTGEDILAGGFQALYATALIPYLPLAIEQIYLGNTDVIAGLARELTGDPSIAYSAVWFSVECHDEAPFNDAGKVKANGEAHPRFKDFVLSDPTPTVCTRWGVEPAGRVETEPVHSDIPALVLAGEYDPIHPPQWSRLAASTLSQSFLYELPGSGHGVSFDGCGQKLVENFIQRPTTAPDAACVEQMGSPAFVSDLYLNRGIYRLASGLLLDFDLLKALPLLICLLIFISVFLVIPIGAALSWQRRTPREMSPLVYWTRWLALVAAVLNLAFVIALLIFIINTSMEQEYLLLFGLPSGAALLFIIPWFTALLGVVLLVLVVLVWQNRRGSLLGRVYYTVVTVAVLGFIWVLNSWGLLNVSIG
jgi:hypothetical protein